MGGDNGGGWRNGMEINGRAARAAFRAAKTPNQKRQIYWALSDAWKAIQKEKKANEGVTTGEITDAERLAAFAEDWNNIPVERQVAMRLDLDEEERAEVAKMARVLYRVYVTLPGRV
jgi:hypothetical protein